MARRRSRTRVPLLENLGFRVVNERTYTFAVSLFFPLPKHRPRVWLHDMTLERAAGGVIKIDDRSRR